MVCTASAYPSSTPCRRARGRGSPRRRHLTQGYDHGVPEADLARGTGTDETGTAITFWADDQIFETTKYDFETLARRFQEMAFLNKGLTISLTDERDPTPHDGELTEEDLEDRREVEYHYAGGIADFVRHLNATKGPANPTVIHFEDETPDRHMAAEVALQWNQGFSESVYTFANTINTVGGGTHEEGFRTALTSLMNKFAREWGS